MYLKISKFRLLIDAVLYQSMIGKFSASDYILIISYNRPHSNDTWLSRRVFCRDPILRPIRSVCLFPRCESDVGRRQHAVHTDHGGGAGSHGAGASTGWTRHLQTQIRNIEKVPSYYDILINTHLAMGKCFKYMLNRERVIFLSFCQHSSQIIKHTAFLYILNKV